MKKLWTCTVCGKRDFWRNGWSIYGSDAHEEACLEDLPIACSEVCHKTVTENLKSGKWAIPKLALRCGMVTITRERKGY